MLAAGSAPCSWDSPQQTGHHAACCNLISSPVSRRTLKTLNGKHLAITSHGAQETESQFPTDRLNPATKAFAPHRGVLEAGVPCPLSPPSSVSSQPGTARLWALLSWAHLQTRGPGLAPGQCPVPGVAAAHGPPRLPHSWLRRWDGPGCQGLHGDPHGEPLALSCPNTCRKAPWSSH